jgi:uncharacterized protein (UPF0548 family)
VNAPELAARTPNYAPVGATRPGDARWTSRPTGVRSYERSVSIGVGQAAWTAASSALLEWGVKTRSGFRVEPGPGVRRRVETGGDYWLIAAVGPFSVREPVRVVSVVEEADRCGFAYGTLDGHPVSGEEAFIVHRAPDGTVSLTLRSLTRAPAGSWRLAYPGVLIAQRWFRFRYLRALRSAA